MRRVLVPSVVLVSLLSFPALAQHHTTGWIYQGNRPPAAAPHEWLGWADPHGDAVSMILPSSVWTYPFQLGYMGGAAMDVDNRNLVVSLTVLSFVPNGLVQFNAAVLATSTGIPFRVLMVSPTVPNYGTDCITDVAVDQNGDYVLLLTSGSAGPARLVRVSRIGGAVTTVFAGAPLVAPTAFTIDVDTGDFIVLDGTWSAPLYRLSPGKPVSTLATRIDAPVNLAQLASDGAFYLAGGHNTIPSAAVLRVDSAGRGTTLVTAYSAAFPRGLYAVAADRSSASRPRLLVASQSDWSSGLFYVDSATGAVTTVISNSLCDYRIVIAHRGRNLSTHRLATGRWTVQLSFPGEPGNPYVAVLTSHGIRPGVRLADGRRFLVNLDVLTLLSWTGRLGSVFRGNVGVLDSLGEARAHLDVSSLLPVVRGLRVWVGAFTLNPGAPIGIQTIADPIVLNL